MIRSQVVRQVLLGASALIFTVWMDYATDGEINFSALYFLPVVLWAWYLGLVPSLIMSVLCAGGWMLNDLLSHHVYAHVTARIFNTGVHALAFMAAAVGVYLLHRRFEQQTERNCVLARIVAEVEQSVDAVRKFRNQRLMICPVTGRVKIGKEWLNMDSFLREKLGLSINTEVSEEVVSGISEKMIEYYGWRE